MSSTSRIDVTAENLKKGDVIIGEKGSRLTVTGNASLTSYGDSVRVPTEEFDVVRFKSTRILKVDRTGSVPVGTVKNFRGSPALRTESGWIVMWRSGAVQGVASTRQDDEFWATFPTVEFPG